MVHLFLLICVCSVHSLFFLCGFGGGHSISMMLRDNTISAIHIMPLVHDYRFLTRDLRSNHDTPSHGAGSSGSVLRIFATASFTRSPRPEPDDFSAQSARAGAGQRFRKGMDAPEIRKIFSIQSSNPDLTTRICPIGINPIRNQ